MAKKRRSLIIQKLIASKTFQISSILFLVSYFFILLSTLGVINLNNYKFTYQDAIYFISIIVFVITLSTTMFSYLQGSNRIESNTINGDSNFQNSHVGNFQMETEIARLELAIHEQKHIIRDYIESIKQENEDNISVKLNLENNEEILQEVKLSIKNTITKEFIDELNSSISEGFVHDKNKSIAEIKYIGNEISRRLISEIEKLDRKSNINLIIGSLTTSVAFIGLAIVVFGQPAMLHNMDNILFHYVPRISFIVFIEVFAFFFLRLYKLNLNDIKYYQNELTNIELKILSAISSIKFGIKEDLSTIVAELSKTERNFILEKGQTTIEFEKFKFENNSVDKLSKILKTILPKLK